MGVSIADSHAGGVPGIPHRSLTPPTISTLILSGHQILSTKKRHLLIGWLGFRVLLWSFYGIQIVSVDKQAIYK